MNQETNNETEDDAISERNICFEIPHITTSSPSSAPSNESIASPIYVNAVRPSLARSVQSDEETDTSFTSINNAHNGHVSALRTLSPGNLNASNTSRGVTLCLRIWLLIYRN